MYLNSNKKLNKYEMKKAQIYPNKKKNNQKQKIQIFQVT